MQSGLVAVHCIQGWVGFGGNSLCAFNLPIKPSIHSSSFLIHPLTFSYAHTVQLCFTHNTNRRDHRLKGRLMGLFLIDQLYDAILHLDRTMPEIGVNGNSHWTKLYNELKDHDDQDHFVMQNGPMSTAIFGQYADQVAELTIPLTQRRGHCIIPGEVVAESKGDDDDNNNNDDGDKHKKMTNGTAVKGQDKGSHMRRNLASADDNKVEAENAETDASAINESSVGNGAIQDPNPSGLEIIQAEGNPAEGKQEQQGDGNDVSVAEPVDADSDVDADVDTANAKPEQIDANGTPDTEENVITADAEGQNEEIILEGETNLPPVPISGCTPYEPGPSATVTVVTADDKDGYSVDLPMGGSGSYIMVCFKSCRKDRVFCQSTVNGLESSKISSGIIQIDVDGAAVVASREIDNCHFLEGEHGLVLWKSKRGKSTVRFRVTNEFDQLLLHTIATFSS